MPPRPRHTAPEPRSRRAPNARRHLHPVPDPTRPQQPCHGTTRPPTEPTHATATTISAVFSPGRLRAYRDLAGLTRSQLATNTRLPVAAIIAYEEGTIPPIAKHLCRLAGALAVRPSEFTGPPGADDSWEYWGLICAAMPPMTAEQIESVAVVLRRIEQKTETDQQHQPRAA